jgi:aryl-phospho-beta-D-glucosidase BglC (GH1 family)
VFQPPTVARPEDGHSRWLKHVGGQADYNIINLHTSVYTCWLILVKNNHCVVMNHLKLRIYILCHVMLLDEWLQHFKGSYCIYLQGQVIQEDFLNEKMEALGYFTISGNNLLNSSVPHPRILES